MGPSGPRAWAQQHWWALTSAAVGALIAGFLLCLWLQVGGDRVDTWFDDLGETAAPILASGAAALAAARSSGRYRAAWALMSGSAFSWGIGQGAWSWYELIDGISVPFPSLADAGYLGAVPLAMAGVLAFPVAHERLSSVAHTLLDGMLIGAALLVVSWETVLGAVYRTAPNGALAAVLSLMYPVSDVAIITMILVRLSRAPRRGRSVLLMLAAGLAIMAVADSSFAYLTAAGTYGTGNLLDTGWFGGYLIIGLAALRFVALPVRQAPPLTVTSRLQQLLPYPAVAAAFAVIIAQRVTSSTIDLFAFWSMLAIVLLVLVRQYLALGANVALVGTLAAREREMAYQAHHDALTDLPNRLAFRDAVTRALDNTRAGGRCAVMFIDLDDFKQINDRYGHASGDSVLRLVAERIKSNLRPEDVASRLGGDEFAVLVENAKSTTAVDTIARRILLTLRQPAAMDGRMLPVRGTIGIAISDRTVGGCDELLRRADVAMYAAKREGKDRCAVYTELAA